MSNDLTEVDEATKWMVALFKADSELIPILGTGDTARVYVDKGRRELGFPYLVINYMSGDDIPGLGVNRIMTIANFQVRIVTETVPTVVDKKAAKRMDILLQTAVKLQFGEYYFTSRRMQPLHRKDSDEVKTTNYYNLGGIYRVWISKTP